MAGLALVAVTVLAPAGCIRELHLHFGERIQVHCTMSTEADGKMKSKTPDVPPPFDDPKGYLSCPPLEDGLGHLRRAIWVTRYDGSLDLVVIDEGTNQ